MNRILKEVIEHAATWPQEDQDEFAEYARKIEARRIGISMMSDDERAAVAKGLAEADRGEFVSDEQIAEADKRAVARRLGRFRDVMQGEKFRARAGRDSVSLTLVVAKLHEQSRVV